MIAECPDYFSARLKWLWNNRLEKLINHIQSNEKFTVEPLDIFKVFVAADPSQNKSALQWLMETYLRNGFLLEDIQGDQSKVWDTLMLFDRYRTNLDQQKRNIYEYKTLARLYKSVQIFHQKDLDAQENGFKSKNQLKTDEKMQVLKETHVLLDQPNLKIIIPLTQNSAQWWGRGTRWCTAAQNNNMFDYYNDVDPLIILLFQDKTGKHRKLQLFVNEKSYQFMNEADEYIDDYLYEDFDHDIYELYEYNHPIDCIHIVKENFIEDNFSNLQIAFSYALSKNTRPLEMIPDNLQTYEMCKLSATNKDLSKEFIKKISKKFDNTDIYSLAVENDGTSIVHVPTHKHSLELYKKAIKQNSFSLYHILPILDKRLVFFKQIQFPEFKLGFRRNRVIQELCFLAIKDNGNLLQIVPEKLIDYQMCKQAVENTGLALQHVPEKYLTKEICSIAVQKNMYQIYQVPEDYRSYNFYLDAFNSQQEDNTGLRWVPDKFRTKELCLKAVITDYSNLSLVPESILNKDKDDFYKAAVKNNFNALKLVPKKSRTLELCTIAIEQNGLALKYVRKQMKTYELCLKALKSYDNKTLLKQDTSVAMLPLVPDELKTYAIYRLAVSKQGQNLFYVPDECRTVELCVLALKQDYSARKHIPVILENDPAIKVKFDQLKPKGWTIEKVQKEFDQIIKNLILENSENYSDQLNLASKH